MPHVLIVDDDEAFVTNCTALLHHGGYEVLGAASVASARKIIAASVPDAMLLDWQLPDGTALDILSWLQSRNLRIPAALVTGFWFRDDFQQTIFTAKSLGVCACVRRGLDLDDPVEVVRRLLDALTCVHRELLLGTESASEVLADALLHKITRRLRARFGPTCAELASDAATDAIVEHLHNPKAFDPVRDGLLEVFVWRRARRTLSNALRSGRREMSREAEYASLRATHSGSVSARNCLIEQALCWEPDTRVRSALGAWLHGDSSHSVWMTVPSVRDGAVAERTREIKRQKDRFIARVKRLARRRAGTNK